MNLDVAELPPKGSELDFRQDSKRTNTKWFNPMTFDPRTPDYYETVRTEWQEDVTREDFGMSNIKSNLKIIIFNKQLSIVFILIGDLTICSQEPGC